MAPPERSAGRPASTAQSIPPGLSRRSLLFGAAGLAAVGVTRARWPQRSAPSGGPAAATSRAIGAGPQAGLDIFNRGWPRAFVYRQAGLLAATLDYATWADQVSVLNGIVGKVFPEENPVPPQVLAYFQQFKAANPTQMVVEHLNGWERVWDFQTTNWWPGFWLYRAGTNLTTAAAATDTTLSVGSTAPFSLTSGERHRGDDIVLAPTGANGAPDFTQAEQVVLIGIDATTSTLTVRRGQYGTAPLAFPSGAYVAPHVVRGPFIGDGPMLWMYNLSSEALPDPNGNTVIDAVIDGLSAGEGMTAWFAAGGPLAAFDGIALDALAFAPPAKSNADCNNDNVVDYGVFNGVNTFGLGSETLVDRIRSVVGPSRLVVQDGEAHQRPNGTNGGGIEVEGFPTLSDPTFAQWATARTTLEYWPTAFGNQPALCYPLYKPLKWNVTPGAPDPNGDNRWRLTVAAALLTGTALSFYYDPDGGTATNCSQLTIWDEVLGGTLTTPNWLGQPLQPAQHTALTSDALAGNGTQLTASFLDTVAVPDGSYSVQRASPSPVLTISGSTGVSTLSFTISPVPLPASDLVVAFDVSSDPETSPGLYQTDDLGRRLSVAALGTGVATSRTVTQSTPTGSNWFTAVLYFRGMRVRSRHTAGLTFAIEGPQNVYLRNIRVFNAPDVMFRQFAGGAVFANPSEAAYTWATNPAGNGQAFSRLQATSGAGQDPVVNDGSPVSFPLTVPAMDALVVVNG